MSLKEEPKKEKKPKKAKPKKKISRNYILYDFVKVTGIPPVCLWLRPKNVYIGDKKKHKGLKGMLIAANHNSLTDPVRALCAFWKRRLHMLATTDLYSTKIKKFFFKQMHCIPVDKQNFNTDSIHVVVDRLKAGKAVVIFPEGTVSHEDDAQELDGFKSGAPLMAYLANVPIIPVYFVKKKKWYHRNVTLIGDPINVREICPAPSIKAIDNASDVLRERILELKSKYLQLQEEKKHDHKSKR